MHPRGIFCGHQGKISPLRSGFAAVEMTLRKAYERGLLPFPATKVTANE